MARQSPTQFRDSIVDRVIGMLELSETTGKLPPWRKPWKGPEYGGGDAAPVSLSTRKRYQGINYLLLGWEQEFRGYQTNVWGTFNQISQQGGKIRKGERSTVVVLYKTVERDQKNPETGEVVTKPFFIMTGFNVFNLDQADWENGHPKWVPVPSEEETIDGSTPAEEALQAYWKGLAKVSVRKNNPADYHRKNDIIRLPAKQQFSNPSGWFGVAFHESVHSTGHPSRLARETLMEFTRHGDDYYSQEELVAEMGAAMLLGHFGLSADDTEQNSAVYCAGWAHALRENRKLLFAAAGQAEKAVSTVLGKSPEALPEVD